MALDKPPASHGTASNTRDRIMLGLGIGGGGGGGGWGCGWTVASPGKDGIWFMVQLEFRYLGLRNGGGGVTGIIYMFYTGSEYGLAIGHRQVRDRIMLERGWGWGWGGGASLGKEGILLMVQEFG